MRLSQDQIISLLKAEPLVAPKDPTQVIESMVWDSRLVKKQGAFLALPGEQVDGNDYLGQAIEAEASLLIASRQPDAEVIAAAASSGIGLVKVADSQWALGEIALYWRRLLPVRVVAVTGSSGKTSTKELVGAVLVRRYRTQSNPGNYNNLIGLPATILDCQTETELLVLEMGMQKHGEITRYSEISQPEVAVFTNIGLAHLELLGSQDSIAEAKAELLWALPDNMGVAVLNGDDPYSSYLLETSKARQRGIQVIYYGLDQNNAVRAENVSFDINGCPEFDVLLSDGQRQTVKLQMPGEHNISNALAAAAVGELFDVSPADIKFALESSQPLALRQQTIDLPGGATILNDCYNANPGSMRAALQALQIMDTNRPHIAVLGDMLELGDTEADLHREIGEVAAGSGLSLLVTVGQRAKQTAAAARACGMQAESVQKTDDWQEAVTILQSELYRNPIILVKASRSMALERIVEALLEQ
ncbi:MAG: UDP-N-acetylmuramoyl-tripeptide--D-alanyl-D-alanine ligase [Coriobacteriales bacterium]|nr:UDP-N-acetylmuramoyl-tripeptide--D-alanyl-D-alanine ligase [Coriobacteriales bacterium]